MTAPPDLEWSSSSQPSCNHAAAAPWTGGCSSRPPPLISATDLDSILKSRDITLPTKACLVKAMVFPVVIYGCESWTVKKAEC